jgi:hypothetical protein
MTRMIPLLERNEQFARTYTPAALGIPARQVLIYDIATGRLTTTHDARHPE